MSSVSALILHFVLFKPIPIKKLFMVLNFYFIFSLYFQIGLVVGRFNIFHLSFINCGFIYFFFISVK